MAPSAPCTTSHWAPTVCIQVPTLLTSTAIHSVRNSLIRSGAQDDEADPEPAMPRFSSLWARAGRSGGFRHGLIVIQRGYGTEIHPGTGFPVRGAPGTPP